VGLFKNLKIGLDSIKNPPTPEEIEASLASLTPEQRAAYDANMARVEQGRAESTAAWAEARAANERSRILDGPAGDFLHGAAVGDSMSPDAVEARIASEGLGAIVKEQFTQSANDLKGTLGELARSGKVDEIADPAVRAQVTAEHHAARRAAREPFLGPSTPQVAFTRIPTRGGTQIEEVVAFLRQSGLAARPDKVFGVYRVPDRISPGLTPQSEKGRVVEWEVVHDPSAGGGAVGDEVADAWFPSDAQWVARRIGEPSVLDEDLATAYCLWAQVGPEQCLGMARFGNFIARQWDYSEDTGPITPQVVGIHVFHRAGLGEGMVDKMAQSAPIPLGPDHVRGVVTEVLNAGAVREAVHRRPQDPIPVPSPFPYLPATPQELLMMYLEVVGISPSDCYGAQVTIQHVRELSGRFGPAGSTNLGPKQPCADGKDRMRLHGAEQVVVTYRDSPAYVEGRARWAAYQQQVLQAHLERGLHLREAVRSDKLSHGVGNPLLRAGAHLLDSFDSIDQFLAGRRPNPFRYCWPPIDG
jgi:hypothetical protein